MSESVWRKAESGRYLAEGDYLLCRVDRQADDDGWGAFVTVCGHRLHMSEHASRDEAMAAALEAAARAEALMRFDEHAPTAPVAGQKVVAVESSGGANV